MQARVYDRFVALFRERVWRVSNLGNLFATDTYHGPQVLHAQFERVRAYFNSGGADSATTVTAGSGGGGAHHDLNDNRNGDVL